MGIFLNIFCGTVLLLTPPVTAQWAYQPCSPVNYLAAYPGVCGRFLACATFGFVPMDCPSNLAFNEARQVCDYRIYVPGCADEETSRCKPNPCGMYGNCAETPLNPRGFRCECLEGYDGDYCSLDINECRPSNPCVTGTCVNTFGSFYCECGNTGYTGQRCEIPPSGPCIGDQPCQFGTCIYSTVNRCNCTAGYTGTLCETNIDECSNSPCQNGGMCIDLVNNYRCDCSGTGFTGNNCMEPEGCVAGQPCEYGTCMNSPLGPVCACIPGYTGVFCHNELDECSSNPCQNGGTCIDGVNGFSCECGGTGFTGDTCSTPVPQCTSNNDCIHGVCVTGVSGRVCQCDSGYTGTNCDTDINECSTNPCSNGGRCIDLVNGFTCDCTGTGFTGNTCAVRIVTCTTDSNCLNGGTCISTLTGRTCQCVAGFTGNNCETEINECSTNPCSNGGRCIDLVNGFTCDCTGTGFTGNTCTIRSMICATDSDCLNGGTCVNTLNGVLCRCVAGFAGSNCETEINECSTNPCSNGGRCIDLINGFTCDCTGTGFTGNTCTSRTGVCSVDSDCLNGGICSLPTQTCLCGAGFTGTLCEARLDFCTLNPCNSGRCFNTVINGIETFQCDCTGTGFTGQFCDLTLTTDPCASNPCLNGVCLAQLDGSYKCDCSGTLFYGANCQFPAIGANDCDPNLCANGVCIDGVNTFTCDCSGTEYRGALCEYTACTVLGINPCRNGGTCTPTTDEYMCECASGFTGANCQSIILPDTGCPPMVCPVTVPRHNYPAWNDTTCGSYYNCQYGVLTLQSCPGSTKFDVITMDCQVDTGPPRFFCDSFLQ